MRFKLKMKKVACVVNDVAPELTVYFTNSKGQFDLMKITFQKMWCWLVGHRYGEWEDTKYTGGRSRVCTRCRDHWDVDV